jgi:hypothetical protein
MVVHAYNLSSWEVESTGRKIVSSRPAWATKKARLCFKEKEQGRKICLNTVAELEDTCY